MSLLLLIPADLCLTIEWLTIPKVVNFITNAYCLLFSLPYINELLDWTLQGRNGTNISLDKYKNNSINRAHLPHSALLSPLRDDWIAQSIQVSFFIYVSRGIHCFFGFYLCHRRQTWHARKGILYQIYQSIYRPGKHCHWLHCLFKCQVIS